MEGGGLVKKLAHKIKLTRIHRQGIVDKTVLQNGQREVRLSSPGMTGQRKVVIKDSITREQPTMQL